MLNVNEVVWLVWWEI